MSPQIDPDLLRDLVGRLQRAFYPETVGAPKDQQRGFYQDLRLLRMAASYPAFFIRENAAGEFDSDRYIEIFDEIIRKVKNHGPKPAKMLCRGAYLLKAVQDHWRHNWEAYQPEAKTAAAKFDQELRAIASRREIQSAPDLRPMALLASVHDALITGRPPKPKAPRPSPKSREIQSELF